MEAQKNKTTLLIMATGTGFKFGSLKQLVLLEPQKNIITLLIYDAVHAGFDKIVFIIRKSFEQEFKEVVGKYAESLVETVYCFKEMDRLPGNLPPIEREKPWGTAHAIWSVKDSIQEPFIAINADDFYRRDAFVKLHDFVATNPDENCFSLAGYCLAPRYLKMVPYPGEFENRISDFDATLLIETILFFHNVPRRQRELLEALEKAEQSRIDASKELVEYLNFFFIAVR